MGSGGCGDDVLRCGVIDAALVDTSVIGVVISVVISARSPILWLSDSDHLCRGFLCCGLCVVIRVPGSFALVPCQTAIQYAASHALGWSLAEVPCQTTIGHPIGGKGCRR